jgi:pyridoxamine 5'-phosphate oxidase
MTQPPKDISIDCTKLRVDYRQRSLSEHEVDVDPIRQFAVWLSEAIDAGAQEPNAMTLATAGRSGAPSARMVLLKEVDARGFAFYTNYQSRKARELSENPAAALVFWWPELERSVRVEGPIERTSQAESDVYFAKRPPDSRIGAAASDQGQVVPSREFLEKRFAELRARYPDGNVPRPEQWGGFRVKPTRVEFWQGRPSRLHDRIEYVMEETGWRVRRLAP